jgi:hypothetical protein
MRTSLSLGAEAKLLKARHNAVLGYGTTPHYFSSAWKDIQSNKENSRSNQSVIESGLSFPVP